MPAVAAVPVVQAALNVLPSAGSAVPRRVHAQTVLGHVR